MEESVGTFSENSGDLHSSDRLHSPVYWACASNTSTSISKSQLSIAHSAHGSSDADVLPTATLWTHGKRMFPEWKPTRYGEWQFYPDRKERRHDVMWRGEQTREEATLESSTMLGCKTKVIDSRGAPCQSAGDKPYQVVEYLTNFHKMGSTRPVINFGMMTYKTKRTQQLWEEEITEVQKLCKWKPSSPLKP